MLHRNAVVAHIGCRFTRIRRAHMVLDRVVEVIQRLMRRRLHGAVCVVAVHRVRTVVVMINSGLVVLSH